MVYLSGYFTDPPALFHPELIHSLESEDLRRLLIIGFRGSGKSTFGSLALPLWAALEYPEKFPFIILIADSTRRATLNISAIKHELETNNLIKQDYGEIKGKVIEDFALKGEGEEWQKQNIVLSNGVRILARSRGQKVRGLRHLEHRPKLVVVDDPEDGEWVRTKENRDKTDRWLHSEVMPGLDARKPSRARTVFLNVTKTPVAIEFSAQVIAESALHRSAVRCPQRRDSQRRGESTPNDPFSAPGPLEVQYWRRY